MPVINQIVAGFTRGDAISQEAVALQRVFASWGCGGEIFCERRRVLPELRGSLRDLDEVQGACGPDSIAFLHLSIGSPCNAAFMRLAARKAILYHNITPPAYFRAVQPATAAQLELGRRQLAALAGVAEVNLAVSRYNAGELEAAGYRDVGVVPLVVDWTRYDAPPDRALMRELDDGRVNILFVGRGAPNKRIDDLLQAVATLRYGIEPRARLIHVGSYAGAERYRMVLEARARELGLRDTRFMGAIPQAALNACYRTARVFLCMSEHEGVCIPLLEAMRFDLPVAARACAAVPETLDGAGVLFAEPDYPLIAELLARLAQPGALRDGVLAAQRARLARYQALDLGAELRRRLAPLL